MQTLPETPFQMPLYWLIEWHVYKRFVLPWQQLISNLTKGNSANDNAWLSVSWLICDLTWHRLVKRKPEFNLLPSWRSVSHSVDGRVDLTLDIRALNVTIIWWLLTQLGKVLETLKQQVESKGRELQEFRETHNIQLRGEDDAKSMPVSAAAATAKSSGVLVASGSS